MWSNTPSLARFLDDMFLSVFGRSYCLWWYLACSWANFGLSGSRICLARPPSSAFWILLLRRHCVVFSSMPWRNLIRRSSRTFWQSILRTVDRETEGGPFRNQFLGSPQSGNDSTLGTGEDTGNKVIQQFVKRVLDNSLQPLVNVLSLLIWKHLEICFTASNKVKCKERILQDDAGRQSSNSRLDRTILIQVQCVQKNASKGCSGIRIWSWRSILIGVPKITPEHL